MADTAFDVPGSVTLRMVSRRNADETPDARLFRLAQKAVIEGCHVYRIQGRDTLFAVTSSRGADVTYLVDVQAGTCTCEGFARWAACKHLAVALAELGELPDPEPPTPAAPAVACASCDGLGYRRMQSGDRLSDWIALECRTCLNTGRITPRRDLAVDAA